MANKAHEKILNITSHQGNTNQNSSEILLCTHFERKTVTSAGEDVEKLELSYTVGGNAKSFQCRCFGKKSVSSSYN